MECEEQSKREVANSIVTLDLGRKHVTRLWNYRKRERIRWGVDCKLPEREKNTSSTVDRDKHVVLDPELHVESTLGK
jgi:hypothetical protein